jgi:hypothetical protein
LAAAEVRLEEVEKSIRECSVTEQIKQGNQFLPVFQEPSDELDADWTHGLLLVGIGQFPQIEWLEAARSYSGVALHLVERALSEGVYWDNAHPALFMCRHALELYLKTAISDWASIRGKNGHALAPLINRLRLDLKTLYHHSDVERLCQFLEEFSEIDPNATVFRFPDGKGNSTESKSLPHYELWVDFRALKFTAQAVFRALDLVCLDNMGRNR